MPQIVVQLMPAYQFVTRNNGTGSEHLGWMDLLDDATAIAFGNRLMRDMMHGAPRRYAGWTINITQDTRTVGSVRFK
jgi:hypothetical protein